MQFAVDYRHLLTALKLGFREIRLSAATRPAWCVNGDRRYVSAAMHPSQVQYASPHAVAISTQRDLVAA